MRKFCVFFLTLVLAFGLTIPASAIERESVGAAPVETEAQKITRVKAEVLSGNITNEADVIEVALMQLNEKIAYCRANGIAFNPDESLSITQVLESDADTAGGESEQDVAVTGLLMVDENGEQITATDYLDDSGDNTIGILGGNIIATTTMTIRMQVTTSGSYSYYKTRIYKLSTTVQNHSGYVADTLQHLCSLVDSNPDNTLYTSSVTSNPASNVPITYYPPTSYIDKGAGTYTRYVGQARITKNGTEYNNVVIYDL